MENTEKPLRRSQNNKKIAGVCGGIAEKLEVDPVMVRVVFVLMFLFGGGGLLAYLILWFILPEEPWIQASAVPAEGVEREAEVTDNQFEAEPPVVERNSKKSFQLGLILIIAGLFFLAAAFIPGIEPYDIWPVVLIAVGVYLIKPSWSTTKKS